jgi:hypothetical protein
VAQVGEPKREQLVAPPPVDLRGHVVHEEDPPRRVPEHEHGRIEAAEQLQPLPERRQLGSPLRACSDRHRRGADGRYRRQDRVEEGVPVARGRRRLEREQDRE